MAFNMKPPVIGNTESTIKNLFWLKKCHLQIAFNSCQKVKLQTRLLGDRARLSLTAGYKESIWVCCG